MAVMTYRKLSPPSWESWKLLMTQCTSSPSQDMRSEHYLALPCSTQIWFAYFCSSFKGIVGLHVVFLGSGLLARKKALKMTVKCSHFFQGNLSELGRLLMQGSFSVWTEHKKGHAKVKDLARFKPMQRHLFLHEKALLFCKRREENGEGYEKAPSYSFKHSLSVRLLWVHLKKVHVQTTLKWFAPVLLLLQMSAVGITENAKGDNKKFEIWCNSRDEVFIVQVSV